MILRLISFSEARVEPDQAKRAANYKKAAKLVTDDAGGIFVYNTKWFGPYNKKVKGVRFSPIGNAQEMRWVHMEQKKLKRAYLIGALFSIRE